MARGAAPLPAPRRGNIAPNIGPGAGRHVPPRGQWEPGAGSPHRGSRAPPAPLPTPGRPGRPARGCGWAVPPSPPGPPPPGQAARSGLAGAAAHLGAACREFGGWASRRFPATRAPVAGQVCPLPLPCRRPGPRRLPREPTQPGGAGGGAAGWAGTPRLSACPGEGGCCTSRRLMVSVHQISALQPLKSESPGSPR